MKIIDGLQEEKNITKIKELLMNKLKVEYPKIKFVNLQQETDLNISKGSLFKEKEILHLNKYGNIELYDKEYFKIIETLSKEIEEILGEEIKLVKMYEEDENE